MNEHSITLSSKEIDILLVQLGARITCFEDLMCKAAESRKTDRVIEISEIIKCMKDIQNKLLVQKEVKVHG